MKGCGVKAAKAASQATSSDRAFLPTSSQAARPLDTLTLYARCVKSHFSQKPRVSAEVPRFLQ